jgi:outer membrane protein, multidrug efflux system
MKRISLKSPRRAQNLTIKLLTVILFTGSMNACAHFAGERVAHRELMPDAYMAADKKGSFEPAHPWWTDFQKPALNSLIEQALNQNLSLRQSWARIEQAQAIARQRSATLWPSAQLEAQGSASRSVLFFSSDDSGKTYVDNERLGLSLAASYEIDLWGKLKARRKAANHQLEMSRDALETMAMSITSKVSETFFAWIAQSQNVHTLQKQLTTNRQFLELTELRFSQGLTQSTDVYQQRQLVANSAANLEEAKYETQILENQITILVGQMPGTLTLPAKPTLPSLPEQPLAGLPVELLRHRPDLKMAMRDLAAADAMAAAALADMLPSFKLGSSVGYSVTSFSLFSFLDDLIWNLVAGLTQPLFAGGALKAEADRNVAVVKEKLEAYRETLTKAVHEVENALHAEASQKRFIKLLREQARLAKAALNEATDQYLSGTGSFFRVLSATTTVQSLEQSLVFAHQRSLTRRIQLCRSLGGTWTQNLLTAPDTTEPLVRSSLANNEPNTIAQGAFTQP